MQRFVLVFSLALAATLFVSAPLYAEEFKISAPQGEEGFRKANIGPPKTSDCKNPAEGLTYKFIKGIWNYGSCLLVSVPRINAEILRLQDMVEVEIESQRLKNASAEQLKEYEDECEIMLGNIRQHEVMVDEYATKSLFLGKDSPVLGSHEEAKESITSQIARINRKQAKLAAKSDKGADFAASQIRKNDGENFKRMIKLHKLLWKGSAKYREIIMAINERGEKVTLADKKVAIKLYEEKQNANAIKALNAFGFRAQWAAPIKAAIFLDPEGATDADVGSTLAFELTNAYQDDRFAQVHRLAYDGKYDNKSIHDKERRIELGAQQYAMDCEHIENQGRTIHGTIIREAVESGVIDKSWFWGDGHQRPEHERIYHELKFTEYGQTHINYYTDHYTKSIAPHLEQKRKQNLSERMRMLREKQRKY